jgi:hypothetical protein
VFRCHWLAAWAGFDTAIVCGCWRFGFSWRWRWPVRPWGRCARVPLLGGGRHLLPKDVRGRAAARACFFRTGPPCRLARSQARLRSAPPYVLTKSMPKCSHNAPLPCSFPCKHAPSHSCNLDPPADLLPCACHTLHSCLKPGTQTCHARFLALPACKPNFALHPCTRILPASLSTCSRDPLMPHAFA